MEVKGTGSVLSGLSFRHLGLTHSSLVQFVAQRPPWGRRVDLGVFTFQEVNCFFGSRSSHLGSTWSGRTEEVGGEGAGTRGTCVLKGLMKERAWGEVAGEAEGR